MIIASTLDAFTLAYVQAALDADRDADDNELSLHHTIADIDPETLSVMAADCRAFQASCALYADYLEGFEGFAGNDFWVTRCGEGCGFWDGHQRWQEMLPFRGGESWKWECLWDFLAYQSRPFRPFALSVCADGMIRGS